MGNGGPEITGVGPAEFGLGLGEKVPGMTMQKTLFKNAPKVVPPLLRGDPRTTERSTDKMKAKGWDVIVTETRAFVPIFDEPGKFRSGKLRDLWGFCDLIGIGPRRQIVAVQAMQVGQDAKHLRHYRDNKITANKIRNWLRGGRKLVFHIWKAIEKRGAKGQIKIAWVCVERSVTEEDLQEAKF